MMSTIAENVIFAPIFTKLISAKISHRVLGLRKKDYKDYCEKNLPQLRRLLERFQQ